MSFPDLKGGPTSAALRRTYGDDPELIEGRRSMCERLLEAFVREYGPGGDVMVVRAPARINLMGVHIEHRGGYANYMCISREIMMAVRGRDDDRVNLRNVESERFGPRSFSIGAELPPERRGDWMRYIEEVEITPGDWGNYVKAAVLKLQDRLKDRELKGMDIMVLGDIPTAAGLSSSSALVVATFESVILVNRLSLSPAEKTELCGEGEWYVGTRGGAGDHAAMFFGRMGYISHLRFFPLVVEYVPFPKGYRVVACNSLKRAAKAAGARSIFNERIATYEIALMLIKKNYPQHADRLRHLRDVNAENLGVGQSEIYRIIKSLPERATRAEVVDMLRDHRDELERLFRTHDDPPGGYMIRGVCLFGLAECDRSSFCAECLKDGNIELFGKLMYISHDGDRVVSFENGRKRDFVVDVSDESIDRLIELSESESPADRERARLCMQPGSYRCSCEELDLIVDIAKGVPGVVGAGLTGGGLGGCVLALVKEGATGDLIEALKRGYYAPRGLPPAMEVCVPVAGVGRII